MGSELKMWNVFNHPVLAYTVRLVDGLVCIMTWGKTDWPLLLGLNLGIVIGPHTPQNLVKILIGSMLTVCTNSSFNLCCRWYSSSSSSLLVWTNSLSQIVWSFTLMQNQMLESALGTLYFLTQIWQVEPRDWFSFGPLLCENDSLISAHWCVQLRVYYSNDISI